MKRYKKEKDKAEDLKVEILKFLVRDFTVELFDELIDVRTPESSLKIKFMVQ